MNELYQVYKEKNYAKFLELFYEYLEQGYGVDIPIINTYIIALTKMRKYDEAMRALKNVEKELLKDRLITPVVNAYIRCFKLEEAERVIREQGIEDLDPLVLVELYLLEGKIEEAKLETKIIRKNYSIDEAAKNRLDKYEKMIYNYEYKNAKIEIEYSYFLKGGNELEPGHIIFLKKKPETDERAAHDTRAINRPYMIWKIEEEKLYLFPVSGKCREGFRLFHQRYPNSMGDRVIKNNTCTTTKENVLSVKDKVLVSDFESVLRTLYDSLYFGNQESREINEKFIDTYLKKPEKYDVVETINRERNKHLFYLILDEKMTGIEIDIEEKEIMGEEEIIDKNTMFYNVIELDERSKNYLKDQLKINAFSR